MLALAAAAVAAAGAAHRAAAAAAARRRSPGTSTRTRTRRTGSRGAFGQAGIAERCSTDQYTIKTELLPQSATEQRIQLLRRLVAKDSSISLMSLDPVFTAEFAEAGFLEPLPDDARPRAVDRTTCKGAIDGATWNDQLVAAPPVGQHPDRCGTASRWRRRPAST